MSKSLRLLDDGKMILKCCAPNSANVAAAAKIKECFRKLKIALLACGAVKLAERKLNLLVAGRSLDLPLAETESAIHEICALDCDIKKRALACHAVIRHSRLIHVANIVKLMAMRDVAPTLRACHSVSMTEGASCIEIAVLLLSLGDVADKIIEILLQFRIRMRGQSICRTFDDFVHIGIIVRNAGKALAFALASALEVCDTPSLLTLAKICLDGNDAVGIKTRQPKAGANRNIRHLYCLIRIITSHAKACRQGGYTNNHFLHTLYSPNFLVYDSVANRISNSTFNLRQLQGFRLPW